VAETGVRRTAAGVAAARRLFTIDRIVFRALRVTS